MDLNVSYITNFFLDRHIFLNEKWVAAVLQYLKPQKFPQNILSKAVFDQWIYSNILHSTHPSFQWPKNVTRKIEGVYVFQVNSVVDIGNSKYSQKSTIYDNYNFFDVKDDKPKEVQYERKARRMLMFELFDGENTVKAIEYKYIPHMSLKIMPGAKILIHGSIQTRRQIMWLTPLNCQLLGGDVPSQTNPSRNEIVSPRVSLPTQTNPSRNEIVSPRVSLPTQTNPSQNEIVSPRVSLPTQTNPSQNEIVSPRVSLPTQTYPSQNENVSPRISLPTQTYPSQNENVSPRISLPPITSSRNGNETPLVKKYKESKFTKIAAALNTMRFSIGSKKLRVTAFHVETLEPFQVEDNEWTMKILVADDSHDGICCYVSHKLLCTLIGMTPEEAMVIKNSANVAKRKEGQARIRSLEAQLKRLDLIFEIEFFAGNRATPRITNLETITDVLLE